MFNKTFVFPQTRTEYAPYEKTVTEHRAPTDKSVKLLREMEKAAEDKLISITRLDNNELKATWHVFDDHLSWGMKAVCRFELNGKEHRIDLSLDRYLKSDEIGRKVYKEVCDKIAELLTVDLFTGATAREIGRICR